MIHLLDFDRTLFDVDGYRRHYAERLALAGLSGEPETDAKRVVDEHVIAGTLSFAPGELAQFVYGDVPEFLRMLGNEAVILTFGNVALQKIKIMNALSGIPRLTVLYAGDLRKGEYIRPRTDAFGHSVFVDDNPLELANMNQYCPDVQCFEMRRDGGAGDGRWPVVHGVNELP